MRWFRKLRERLSFFAWYLTEYRPLAGADGDGGGSGDGGGGDGGGSGSGSPAGSGGGDGGGQGGEGGGEKTFTQAELDRIVGERLARQGKDMPTKEELEALREKAGKFDEQEKANATELETAQRERDEAKQAAEKATATVNKTLRRAAIITAAAEAGADPETVHALLSERGFKVSHDNTDHEVTIGDDGQVTGAEDAVKAIIAVKQLSVGNGRQQPGPGDGGPRGGGGGGSSLEELIAKAESEGNWDEVNRLNAEKFGQVKQPN